MKIDGVEVHIRHLRTQYGQFIEVYELVPGAWTDLSSSIKWTCVFQFKGAPLGDKWQHWVSSGGMTAEAI